MYRELLVTFCLSRIMVHVNRQASPRPKEGDPARLFGTEILR